MTEGVSDTIPAPADTANPSAPVIFDRATSDMLGQRLGNLERDVSALSGAVLDIKLAVLAIKAVTDSIPKAFHDSNNHFAGVKSQIDSLERLVGTAMDSQTAIVTRYDQTSTTIEKLVHDVALLKLHHGGANGSMPPDEG